MVCFEKEQRWLLKATKNDVEAPVFLPFDSGIKCSTCRSLWEKPMKGQKSDLCLTWRKCGLRDKPMAIPNALWPAFIRLPLSTHLPLFPCLVTAQVLLGSHSFFLYPNCGHCSPLSWLVPGGGGVTKTKLESDRRAVRTDADICNHHKGATGLALSRSVFPLGQVRTV